MRYLIMIFYFCSAMACATVDAFSTPDAAVEEDTFVDRLTTFQTFDALPDNNFGTVGLKYAWGKKSYAGNILMVTAGSQQARFLSGYEDSLFDTIYVVFMPGAEWQYRPNEKRNQPLTYLSSQIYGEIWYHPTSQSDLSLVWLCGYALIHQECWGRMRYAINSSDLKFYLGPELTYSTYRTQIGVALTHLALDDKKRWELEFATGISKERFGRTKGLYSGIALIQNL